METPIHNGNNEERKEQKLIRQQGFADILQKHLQEGTFKGILPVLREQGIPIGSYKRWVTDPDFRENREQIETLKRLVLNDEFWRAILTGEGIHKAAYLIAALKVTDPEWSDKLNLSGQIGTVNVMHGIPRPGLVAVTPAGQLTQGSATVEQE